GYAQTKKSFSDRFSLEAGYGYVMHIGTLEEDEAQDYADCTNLVIGGHYLFTDVLGARFTYNYSGFDHPDRAELGSKYHRFTLAAGYGYVMPIGTLEEGEAHDYAHSTNLVIGGHYLITDVLGARFTYTYSRFDHPDPAVLGTTYHLFTFAATYDVYAAIIGNEF